MGHGFKNANHWGFGVTSSFVTTGLPGFVELVGFIELPGYHVISLMIDVIFWISSSVT